MRYLIYIFLLFPLFLNGQVGASQQQVEVIELVRDGGSGDLSVTEHRGGSLRGDDFTAKDWRVGGVSIALLHLPFQANAQDISSRNRTLTTLGAPITGIDAGFGTGKNYFEFDGVDDGLDYGTWNISFTQISTIVSFSLAPTEAAIGILISKSFANTHVSPFYNYLMHAHGGVGLQNGRFRISNEIGNSTVGSVLPNDVVHNYLFEWNNGTPNIFLDGTADLAGNVGTHVGAPVTGAQNVRVAARHTPGTVDPNEWLDGRIGYLLMSNRNWSAAQRADLTGQIIPDLSILRAAEVSSTQSVTCRYIAYKNGQVVYDQIPNAIVIP